MLSAFLDTNVLWPSLQRDFLLSLAADDLYRPLWSEAVLDELLEHEALKQVSRGRTIEEAVDRAERLILRMRQSFAEAETQGWEALVGTFGLPDLDDEHVAAAAVASGAAVVVTDNIKDFPPELLPVGLGVQSAAQFLTHLVASTPKRAASSLIAMTSRYRNPAYRPDDVLHQLESRYDLSEAANLIRPLLRPGP